MSLDKTINFNGNTDEEIREYFDIRSKELLLLCYELETLHFSETSVIAIYVDMNTDKKYVSIYIRESFRGKGLYKEIWKMWFETYNTYEVLTLDECGITDFLDHVKIPYKCLKLPTYYTMVRDYYGDNKTERSDVYYMNHIREGIVVLHELFKYWSKHIHMNWDEVFACYCLHPIYQNYANGDESCEEYIYIKSEYDEVGFEYARVANAYLSTRVIDDLDDIDFKTSKAVKFALVADKIQNYKDFIKYHHLTHKGRRRLFNYFHNWFDKFEKEMITDKKQIQELIDKIS